MDNKIKNAIERCFRNQTITSPPTPLKGGHSEATIYKLVVDHQPYVIRYFGPNSSEKYNAREIKGSLLADKMAIGPKVLYTSETLDLLICEFIEGDPLTPDLFQQSSIQALVVHLFQSMHQADITQAPDCDNFFIRILKHISNAKNNGLEIPELDKINHTLSALKNKIDAYPSQKTFCHNDPNSMNFILSNKRLFLIDWRDSGINDPFSDLAIFCFGLALSNEQIRLFLKKVFDKKHLNENDLPRFYDYYQLNLLLQGVWALEKLSQEPNGKAILNNTSPKKTKELLFAFHHQQFDLNTPNDFALYALSCIKDFLNFSEKVIPARHSNEG